MGVQLDSFRLLLNLLGVWTDVSADGELSRGGIRFSMGNSDNGPNARLAMPGTMEFALKNHARNSAGLQGFYSLNHPNCRAGFDYGIGVQLILRFEGVDYARWTGKITNIDSEPGATGSQLTFCTASDIMADLTDAPMRAVTRQINQMEPQLLTVICDAMPVDCQPLARAFDAGLDVLPLAFDDVAATDKALGLANRVMASVDGRLYPLGDGTLRYQSRVSRALEIAQYAFAEGELADLEAPTDQASLFSLVRVSQKPRDFSPGAVVLASFDGTLEIAAAGVEVLWLEYRDPTRPEVSIGGTDYVNPLSPATDYLFNAAADGSGADLTASVAVVAAFFGSNVKLTITNGAGVPAHCQLLQVRGVAIYTLPPVSREASTAQKYVHELAIEQPYASDLTQAQATADYTEASYRSLRNQVRRFVFNPQKSTTLMRQAVQRQIGEVVSLAETMALYGGVSCFIQSIEGEIRPGNQLLCGFGLAPRIIQDEVRAGFEDIGLFDRLGAFPDATADTIGFMTLGYSEIG